MDPQLAKQLVEEIGDQTVTYSDPSGRRGDSGSTSKARTRKSALDGPGATPVQAAANLIDATSFVSVPLLHRNKTLGRVYVTARKARFFNKSMKPSSCKVSQSCVVSVLDHIRLIDQLASEAAEQERRARIARDIRQHHPTLHWASDGARRCAARLSCEKY